jgi:glycosyltransferase involved in cell wall biosynthesis
MIFVVGPLGPPIHGFSEITNRFLKELKAKAVVIEFDTASASLVVLVSVLIRFYFEALKARPKSVYLALSGGSKQWLELFYFIYCRLSKTRLIVHHHSFAYINRAHISAYLCFVIGGGLVTHIVLCKRMGELLRERYRYQADNICVISNSAFLDASPPGVSIARKDITIGFLSNITKEKGILDVLRACRKGDFRALIAGPVSPDFAEEFGRELRCTQRAEYVGPVYGLAKAQFYSSIDFFFFPTQYKNEAEPVVVLDALAAGVPVVAYSAGCIECIIDETCGAVLTGGGKLDRALDYMRANVESLSELRDAAILGSARRRVTARAQLDQLVGELVAS